MWTLAFRDPVDEDIASTYSIPPNSYVDKCICLVSRLPYFQTFRQILEEIHRMCFSPAGCSRPVWDTVAHVISAIRVPRHPNTKVLFTVESCLLCLSAPTQDTTKHLPFTQVCPVAYIPSNLLPCSYFSNSLPYPRYPSSPSCSAWMWTTC